MSKFIIIICCLIALCDDSLAGNQPDLNDPVKFKAFFSKSLTSSDMHAFYRQPPRDIIKSKELNNFDQNNPEFRKLICFGTEHYPDILFSLFPIDDCGGKCGGILPCISYDLTNRVPETKNFFDKLISLSGLLNYNGTHGYHKLSAIDTIRIKLATSQEFLSNLSQNITDDAISVKSVSFYLENFWSAQGIWEKEQYSLLQEFKKQAIAHLTKYYQKTFNYSLAKSSDIAIRVADYAESLYLSSYHDDWSDECLYSIPRFGKTHLKSFVANNKVDLFAKKNWCNPSEKVNYSEIYARLLLIAVVEKYPLEVVNSLLDRIKDGQSKFLVEALHQSAPYYPNALELILKKFPKIVNAPNNFGKTALMYASQYGNIASLAILLKYQANINLATIDYSHSPDYFEDGSLSISSFGRTALIYGAWQGNIEIVKFLVNAGAIQSVADSQGKTAIDYVGSNVMLNNEQKTLLKKILATTNK